MSLELDNLQLNSPGEAASLPLTLACLPGQFTVLLGRTGAGKTRLLRTIAGLEQPVTGRLLLDGEDITQQHARQRNVAMVYQQFINYPHLSVFDNIASPLTVAGVAKSEVKLRVEEVAELLQITPFLPRLPDALSGGQQQRCALARALVKNARVLLFDEPLVNLDAKLRETLRVELKSILADRDCVAVYATTDPHEALALGGHAVLMEQGSALQDCAALDAFYAPVNLSAANLFHEPPLNLFNVEVVANQAQCPAMADQPFALAVADGTYQLGVRADKLILNAAPAAGAALSMAARVTVSEVSASESFVHLNTPAGDWVLHTAGMLDLAPDTEVSVSIPLTELYAFDKEGTTRLFPQQEQACG